jgi:phosphoribosyl 1,2-cyclic phosphate phosphodiesterase
MRITFLGSGTSQGVPIIGCKCAVCASADPRNTRLRPSIYVETADSAFVIDTTPDFRTQCLVNNVNRVDAVVITHTHADHILGLDDLRCFNYIKGGLIPLYASAESMKELRRIFNYAFVDKPRHSGWVEVEPRIIDGAFSIGNATLTPLPVLHGDSVVLGFLIKERDGGEFAYITDVKEIPPAVEEQIRGVPLLILDALRHRPHPSHMSLKEAVAAVERIRPQRALFTHITHELEHAETNRSLPKCVELAFDGFRVEL